MRVHVVNEQVVEKVVNAEMGQHAQHADGDGFLPAGCALDGQHRLPESRAPQDEVSQQADQSGLSSDIEVILVRMAQRLLPRRDVIGRLDRFIVADAHPTPGVLRPHLPASLPMGHPLDDGKVGGGHFYAAYVKGPEVR